MNNKNRFDNKYSTNPKSFDMPPPPIVMQAVGLISDNKVLELGVGNGRNAKYLLKQSLRVIGVDSSQKGLDLLSREVSDNPNLQLVRSDVMKFQTDEQFDLILAIGLLHFLKLDDIIQLLTKMAAWTKPRGVHAVAVRMTQNQRSDLPHIFVQDELKTLYEEMGWEIHSYQETEREWHKVASIITRRP